MIYLSPLPLLIFYLIFWDFDAYVAFHSQESILPQSAFMLLPDTIRSRCVSSLTRYASLLLIDFHDSSSCSTLIVDYRSTIAGQNATEIFIIGVLFVVSDIIHSHFHSYWSMILMVTLPRAYQDERHVIILPSPIRFLFISPLPNWFPAKMVFIHIENSSCITTRLHILCRATFFSLSRNLYRSSNGLQFDTVESYFWSAH